MADDGFLRRENRQKQSPAPQAEPRFGELRHYVPADILNVSLPVSVRGYDRRAVDAYIKRVNRVIAELKVSSSPPAAVRHALEQAGQQVHGLLQSARETAEEITTSARQEADESTARAKAEAAELVVNASAEAERVQAEAEALIAKARTEANELVAKAKAEARQVLGDADAEAQKTREHASADADERFKQSEEDLAALRDQAETRMRELEGDTDAVRAQRAQLLDDVHGMASALADLASAAAARFPPADSAGQKEGAPETDAALRLERHEDELPTQVMLRQAGGHGETRQEVTESEAASHPET